MNQVQPLNRFIIIAITLVYLALFVCGLTASGYLLAATVALKPIPLIGLLKYSLLCVLFLVLLVNAIKALTLKPAHIYRLSVSTKNFKWLFAIAALLCAAAWMGLFNLNRQTEIAISAVQIIALVLLSAFCFWSNSVLRAKTEEEDANGKGSNTDEDEIFTD
jgi:hypothetical protein